MPAALIFDLDGTLWDATVPVTESWIIVGRKYFGPSYELSVETVKGLMGKTMAEIAAALTPENANPDSVDPFVRECFSFEREYLGPHPGKPFPKELETLRFLKETHDLYIVSNCQSGYIENFLAIVEDGLFQGHRCWSDTRKDKQYTIRLLMKEYGIEDAIYIGDTRKDEEATRAAGLPFILAGFGFGTAESPDAVAESFDDLPRAIDEVASLRRR